MANNEQSDVLRLFGDLVSGALCPFPLSGRLPEEVTSSHGVYVIYGADDQVLHVGKSSRGKRGLFQRLTNHLAGQSSFVNLYFRGDRTQVRVCKYRYLAIEDPRKRALVEAYTIGYLCPAHIGLNDKIRISN